MFDSCTTSLRRRGTARSSLNWRFMLASAFVLFFVLATPSHAAELFVDITQGSACHLSNYINDVDYYQRDAARLRNTGSSNWDIFIATCPISERYPGYWWHEYRVAFTLETSSSSPPVVPWCSAFNARDRNPYHSASARRLWGTTWLASGPTPFGRGYRSTSFVTFECMVPKGASLDQVEIVWTDSSTY